MVKSVYVPEAGGIIDFADDVTPTQISGYINAKYPRTAAASGPAAQESDNSGIFGRFAYGLGTGITDIPGGIAALGLPAEKAAQTGAGQFSQDARKYLESTFGIDPTKDPTTAQMLAQGLGSAASFFVPGGAAAKGASLLGKGASIAGRAGAITAAGQGVALGAEGRAEKIQQQLASGMQISESQQLAAQRLDGFIGAAEALPMAKFFGPLATILSKVPASKAPIVEKILSNRLARLTKAGIEEGAQEAASGIANDLVEYGVYNPDVEIGQDIISNAGTGAFVGSTIEGVVQLALGRKIRGARQLQADLQTEAQKNSEDLRKISVAEAANSLAQSGVQGNVTIEPNETPEGSTVYTLTGPDKKAITKFPTENDAVQAVDLYKKMTGAAINVDVSAPPKLSAIRIGNQKFPTLAAAAEKHRKLKDRVNELVKFGENVDLVSKLATQEGVAPQIKAKQISDEIVAVKRTLSMFDRYFSPDVPEAKTRQEIKVGPKVSGAPVNSQAMPAEQPAPKVEAAEKIVAESGPVLEEPTVEAAQPEEDYTESFDVPEPITDENIPDTPIGAVEMPVEESRILPDSIIEEEAPVAAGPVAEAPVAKEKRPSATAEELMNLRTELFGKPIGWFDLTPEQMAAYEAERDKRFPPEDVDVYKSAGPLREPAPRNLREARMVGPTVKDYSPETKAWMKNVYTQLENRLEAIIPGKARIAFKTLVGANPDYLIRGQASTEATPNGIKSIVDLATGTLRPDMTVEAAVKELVGTLNHEMIHVLKDQGVIRPEEWRMLSLSVAKTKIPGKKYTYLDKAEAVYTPEGKPISPIYNDPDAVVEEAVAEMYREWVLNGLKPPQQNVGIFNRITEFFRRIFQTLRNARHEDFFKQIESGEVGRREGEARVSAARYSVGPVVPQNASPQERLDAIINSEWGRYFESNRIAEIVRDVSNKKSGSTIVALTPDQYLKLATHGLRNPGQEKIYAENLDRGMKLNDFPMFTVKTYRNGQTVVTGHEGRHRAAAFKLLGMEKIPVVLRNESYQWGTGSGNKPETTLTGQPPVEHVIEMPDSLIFPMSERGTKDLNDLIGSGESVTSVSIGLAPDEKLLVNSAVEAIAEDDFYGTRKVTKKEIKELTPKFLPAGVARISNAIQKAARESGASRVYNTSGMGVYGGTAIEPSSAVEAVVPFNKAYNVASRMAMETFRIAEEQNQSDAFVAVKLPRSNWMEPYARPGITLYFYNRTGGGRSARSLSDVKKIIEGLPGADVIGGYSAIASERSTAGRVGLEEGYEAIRFIWMPEYAGAKLQDLADNLASTLKAMNSIAKYAEENNIASASIDYYDVALGSRSDYGKRIKEHRKLRTSGLPQDSGKSGPWRRPVSESVSQRTGERIKGGANYSVNVQGAVKRFSAAPLPPYIQQQNSSLFAPAVNVSTKDKVFSFFSGRAFGGKTLNTLHGQIEISGSKMAGISGKEAVTDKNAYITELEKLLNEKLTGNYQRMEANYSATAALAWRRRSSHIFASMLLRGNVEVNFDSPGDMQSATIKVVDEPDSMKEIFNVITEKGPTDANGVQTDKSDIFRSYAVARRGEWLRASGQSVPAQLTPQYIREVTDFTTREYPEVVEAYNKYQRFNKKLLTTAKDAGLISQAELGRLTNQMNYYGFIYEAYGEPLGPTSSQKTASKFKLRPYTGTQVGGLTSDPMFVMMQNAQFWVDSIAKNIAATKAFELTRVMGESRLLGTDEAPDELAGEAPDVMFFSQNGVVKRFAVKDPSLVVALGSDDRLNVGKFWEMIGLPTHILRESVTRDPGFMARNLLRDTVSAWVTSGADFMPVIDTIKGGVTALKNGASYKALGSYGVVGSYDLAMLGPSELAAVLRRNSMPLNVHTVTTKEGAVAALGSLWNRLGHISEASDAATRIAVYDAAKKQGLSDAEAAMQAIELLDFTRRGGSQALGILTKLIPFLNARIQGMDVLYQAGRSGIRYATGRSLGERDANVGKRFLLRGGMLAVIATALEALNQGDDDYEQLDDYIKTGNLILPLKYFGLEGQFFAVPKAFEVGLLFNTIPQQIYKTTTGEASGRENAELFWGSLQSTFGVNPIPQIILPGIEILTNHSFYTGLPLISEGKLRLDPSLQYNSSTSQIAMMLGGLPIFYDMTTGKFGGMSPIVIDKLISGYGGPLGTYLVQATSMMMENASIGPDRMPTEISNLPVVRSFFIDAKSKNPKVVTQAYELFRIADEANRTMSRLRQMGDAEALANYVDQNRDILKYKKYVFALADRLNKLSAQERSIERDGTMSRDEKLAAQQKLREIRIRLSSQVDQINKTLGR